MYTVQPLTSAVKLIAKVTVRLAKRSVTDLPSGKLLVITHNLCIPLPVGEIFLTFLNAAGSH